MSETRGDAPNLKSVLASLIFAARRPLSVREMRSTVNSVADAEDAASGLGRVTDRELVAALSEIQSDFQKMDVGISLTEVAGGYRFQTKPSTSPWVKELLDIGKPSRLSRPALETLAIIGYRQPVTRAEIEAVRGVNVDHVVRSLMEMQMVTIVGRSELPGRPFLYGTTQAFLEHFGLKDISELGELEPGLLQTLETKEAEQYAEQTEE